MEVIPTQLQEPLTSLAEDLAGVRDLKFPRQAIDQDSSINFLRCITKVLWICGLWSAEQ